MTNRLVKRLLKHKQKKERLITVTIKRLFLDGVIEGCEVTDTFTWPLSKIDELSKVGDVKRSFTGSYYRVVEIFVK